MTSPAKLTDTQLSILSEASQREDRCLTMPSGLNGGAAQKIAAKLLTAGLVREIKAKTGVEAWRRDEGTDQAYSLKLTAAAATLAAFHCSPHGFMTLWASAAVEPDRTTPSTIAAKHVILRV
jgi:hypothetical protein